MISMHAHTLTFTCDNLISEGVSTFPAIVVVAAAEGQRGSSNRGVHGNGMPKCSGQAGEQGLVTNPPLLLLRKANGNLQNSENKQLGGGWMDMRCGGTQGRRQLGR